jgi:hypothetical protein
MESKEGYDLKQLTGGSLLDAGKDEGIRRESHWSLTRMTPWTMAQ